MEMYMEMGEGETGKGRERGIIVSMRCDLDGWEFFWGGWEGSDNISSTLSKCFFGHYRGMAVMDKIIETSACKDRLYIITLSLPPPNSLFILYFFIRKRKIIKCLK
jgi:hypothetical protein